MWLCVYAAGLDARSGRPNFVKEFSKTLLNYTRKKQAAAHRVAAFRARFRI
jgi:hypothetical protein